MKVTVRQIEDKADEQVILECVELTRDFKDVYAFALSKGTTLSGNIGDRTYQFALGEVYYFEAVDERVFAYTGDKVYELKSRLYELENSYRERHFVRCSKSVLLNLLRLESISPALNGRFTAHMKNGERLIISRQYVPDFKRAVLGG